MSALPERSMTVDEFLAWAEGREGRYELYNGTAYAMSPERLGHAMMKQRVVRALADQIGARDLPCHAVPDGMTVRVDAKTAHEPDALVYCGPRLPNNAIEVPNPVIVVEVLSPSTRRIDASLKISGYFKLPSVQHYLIVDPDQLPVILHSRNSDGTLLTRLFHDGAIVMNPPGIEIAVAALHPPDNT